MSKFKGSLVEMFNLSTYFAKVFTNFVVNGRNIEFDCHNDVGEYLAYLNDKLKSRHFDEDNAMGNFFKLKSFPFSSSKVKQCDGKKGRFKVSIDDDVLYNFEQHFIQEVERLVRIGLLYRLTDNQMKSTGATKIVEEYIRQGITRDVEAFIRESMEKAVSGEERVRIAEQKEKIIKTLVGRRIESVTEEERRAIVKEKEEVKVEGIKITLDGVLANDERMKGEYARELDNLINSACGTSGTRQNDYYEISANKLIFLKKMRSDEFIKKIKSRTELQISKDLCKTLGAEDSSIKVVKYALINTIFNVSGVIIEDLKGNDECIAPMVLKTRELDNGRFESYIRPLNDKEVDKINEEFEKNGLCKGDFLIKNNELTYIIPYENLTALISDGRFPISYNEDKQSYEYSVPPDEHKIRELVKRQTEEVLDSDTKTSPVKRSCSTRSSITRKIDGPRNVRSVTSDFSDIRKNVNLLAVNNENVMIASSNSKSSVDSGFGSIPRVSKSSLGERSGKFTQLPQQSTTGVKNPLVPTTIDELSVENSTSSSKSAKKEKNKHADREKSKSSSWCSII